MTQGRKVEEARLVNRLDGSEAAKSRLLLFLETLSGRRTITAAALTLGITERRFYQLRDALLQAALDSLEPRSAGRRAHRGGNADDRITALTAQIRDLRLDLRAAQIREELALAMPHLLCRMRKKARKRHAKSGASSAYNCSRKFNTARNGVASPVSASADAWSASSG